LKEQNKKYKFLCRVSNKNFSFCVQTPETKSRIVPVPRNLPISSLTLPNRHKKSNWPEKAKKSQIVFGLFQK